MLKGAVAGTSPTGPWTDGRTGVRTPDDDERHPWRIPLDRPCLLCYLTQKWLKPDLTDMAPPMERVDGPSVASFLHALHLCAAQGGVREGADFRGNGLIPRP